MGAALGAAWQFAPLIPGIGQGIQTGMNIYGYTQLGGAALSTVSGLGQGIFGGDWSALGNAGQIFLGNFYLDENSSFFGGIGQCISRHTWEFIQTGLGHSFAQIRNTFGAVDNVEYFGGATLANRNTDDGGLAGMTLGNFIMGTNLRARTDDWTFMHEYGHTLQSRSWGPLYSFVPALLSGADMLFNWDEPWEDNPRFIMHDIRWYETGANRRAARYFNRHFGTEWDDVENPRSKDIARSLILTRKT